MSRPSRRTASRHTTGGENAPRPAAGEPSPASSSRETALFGLTLFLSAALLFTVQPMFAKMVLPHLGGAPAVWNACLVFYQAALLGGYLYAHLSLRWLGPRRQAVLHLALLAVAWVSLPIHVADTWIPPAVAFPLGSLWTLLAVGLGLPFFALSAHAPMLQAWFAAGKWGRASMAPRPGKQGARLRAAPADGEGPRFPTRDPYSLYAASNLGSLLGLLAYPLLMEAHLTLARQSLTWAVAFGLLMALVAACAARLWSAPPDAVKSEMPRGPSSRAADGAKGDEKNLPVRAIAARRRLHWLALSLVPSSLLMGVTSYITSEIAQMPFLWVLPLALYLLTFVFVFAPRTVLPLKWLLRLQPVLIILAAASLMFHVAGLWEMLLFGSLHLIVFFVTAMVCHGQLATDRPEPARLTEFYLIMSLGGVIGGLFSALLAPWIFHRALEYPLMMAAACMLRPKSSRQSPVAIRSAAPAAAHFDSEIPKSGASSERQPAAVFFSRLDAAPLAALLFCVAIGWGLHSDAFGSALAINNGLALRGGVILLAAASALMLVRRPVFFGLAVAAVAAIGLWTVETGLQVLHAERSFFGVLRVEYDELWNTHQLIHGTTTHGAQNLYADQRREPQGYYHRKGPLGEIFVALKPRRPMAEVGVLGLGAGEIATYAEPGERFTFYEIDPAVEKIAENPDYFTYLADCRGKPEVILGDARLSLQYGLQRQFDLLVLDVFTSDSVPVHLLTREALQLYRSRLRPHGVMAFHISSRYFNLEPVLGRLAADAGLTARIWRDNQAAIRAIGWFPSVWLVMAENPADLGILAKTAYWTAPDCDPGPPWTDEFSNIAGTMHWQWSISHLIPPRWLTASKSRRAKGHADMGSGMLEEGRVEDAVDQFERSLALEPENAPIHYALASALASLGETEKAAEEYLLSVSLDPTNGAAHRGLGVACGKLGKLDEAMLAFRHALELDPTDVDACVNLGKILLDRKKFQDAEKYFWKGIAARPDSAESHFGLGCALMLQGKPARDALAELRRALALAERQGNRPLAEKIEAEIRRSGSAPAP